MPSIKIDEHLEMLNVHKVLEIQVTRAYWKARPVAGLALLKKGEKEKEE